MENENQKSESFWAIARDESAYWDADALAAHGIKAAFGLYLIREGEGTHVCSLTPSSWCEWLRNDFVFNDDATDEQREAAQELEYDDGGEPGHYSGRVIVPGKMDSRFIAGPVEIDPADHDDSDDLHRAIWDAAQEEWHANPDFPTITHDSTYAAWQAETAARAA